MRREPPPDLLKVITSPAPVRICDNGGWTDTWFARHGKVFNLAVRPHVEVQLEVRRHSGNEPRIRIDAENLEDARASDLLLMAAVERMGVRRGAAVRTNVSSEAAAG